METPRGTAQIFDSSSTNRETQHGLFSVAAVMPEQFFAPSFASQTEGPEASLMRAVLAEALSCFQNQYYLRHYEAQRLAKEAELWFFSEETNWPFTFVNICTVLHLEPAYIRRGLRSWQAHYPLKAPQRKRRTIGTRRPLKCAA
jgi:hypothetical protein